MVIGVLSRGCPLNRPELRRWTGTARALFLAAAAFTCVLSTARAEDTITQKNGTELKGQIIGVSGGQVKLKSIASNGSPVTIPYNISDIKSVDMAPPPELAKVKGQSAAQVAAALEPIVKAYAGLPSDWVLDAMGQLADAYSDLGKADESAAIYAQINQLYPNSPYTNIAVAGQAKLLLKQGKLDQALTTIQPVLDAANKNVAASPQDSRAYAAAFLVYGQILEAQKKLPDALEAYLTVKTIFYRNPAQVDESDKLVQNLRAQNPGLSVD